MGDNLDQVPEQVRDHIRQITKTSGLPDTEESVEEMAKGWLEKKTAFEEKLGELNMEEVDEFGADEERGALVLTYSGSILNLGPVTDGVRRAEYVSIGLRQDVPESATHTEAQLAENVSLDEVVSFKVGPIQKSSPIFKIAVNRDVLEPAEEEEKLSDATQVISEEFVEINKTMVVG
jgi:Asp-tRNA(Asn)/Glu-tRNA(Gln) amidotransferase C subunit